MDGDFGWALAQMREGRAVRRKHWQAFEHIRIKGPIIVDEDGHRTSFLGNEPLLALDWELAP